jgi:hypothetical protein
MLMEVSSPAEYIRQSSVGVTSPNRWPPQTLRQLADRAVAVVWAVERLLAAAWHDLSGDFTEWLDWPITQPRTLLPLPQIGGIVSSIEKVDMGEYRAERCARTTKRCSVKVNSRFSQRRE